MSGTFYLGTLSSTSTGPVATNGELTLSGKYTGGTTSINVIYSLQSTTPGVTRTPDLLIRSQIYRASIIQFYRRDLPYRDRLAGLSVRFCRVGE